MTGLRVATAHQGAPRHDEAQLQRRLDYEGANVRSRFVELRMKVSPYDAESGSVRVYLIAWGQVIYEPREGVVQDGQELSQHFFSQVAEARLQGPVDRETLRLLAQVAAGGAGVPS